MFGPLQFIGGYEYIGVRIAMVNLVGVILWNHSMMTDQDSLHFSHVRTPEIFTALYFT